MCAFGAGRARSDVFDGPAWRGVSEVKRTFAFCFRCSLPEVKQISPTAPHHRKVSAPRPPLSAHSRHHTTNTINSPQEYSALHSQFTETKRNHAKTSIEIQLSNHVTGSVPACSSCFYEHENHNAQTVQEEDCCERGNLPIFIFEIFPKLSVRSPMDHHVKSFSVFFGNRIP